MTLQLDLERGLAALGLSLSEQQRGTLLRFVALMAKWNTVYNLTAIREESRMVNLHLLDSLAVLPYLEEVGSLADIGSGGGVPSIPLAIARPDLSVLSVESNSKKSAFQQQARIDLGLNNLDVAHARAEAVVGAREVVISRAFADLADFVKVAGHLLAPGGSMLAMKGVYPDEEIRHLPSGWKLARAEQLSVPGVEGARHLLWLQRD